VSKSAILSSLQGKFPPERELKSEARCRGTFQAHRTIIWATNKASSDEQKELELIQTQMTQKPMLRAEVYARALRASQNRKEDSL